MPNLLIDWQSAIGARVKMETLRPFHIMYQLSSTNAYIYPFWGIIFFFQHYQPLLPLFLSVIIPFGLIHLYVYSIFFVALLPLNLFINVLIGGPVGIQMGILTTIQQCSSLNNYLFREYLIPGKLNKVFDTTLCIIGLDRIVIPGKLKRVVPQSFGSKIMDINPITILAQITHLSYKIWISYLPIIGTIILNYNTSIQIAMTAQGRMWKLTRMRPRQIKYQQKENEVDYFIFGYLCQILEGLPILGLLFCFTDTVGAALMAGEKWKENQMKEDIIFN